MVLTLLENTTIRSRKIHECVVCGLKIPSGTLYQRQKLVDADGFISSALHLCCYNWARTACIDWDELGTWDPADVRENMPPVLQQQTKNLHLWAEAQENTR